MLTIGRWQRRKEMVEFLGCLGVEGGRRPAANLRRYASDGWIINLTPEGQTPDVSTRSSRASVNHWPSGSSSISPILILILRRQSGPFRFTASRLRSSHVSQRYRLKIPSGVLLVSNWTAPLTPAATSGWDEYPAADDIFPWTSPGVTPNRTWVYAPTKALLRRRWSELVAESELEVKRAMFKESAAAKLTLAPDPLPGDDTYKFHGPFMKEQGQVPDPVRVGFRAFDRQWLIPDARLLHRPRRPLWETRIPGRCLR